MRDYDREHVDLADRAYAYDLDYRIHGYMVQRFEPFLRGGRALELGCYEGRFTETLRRRFPSVTVIEASAQLVSRAQARNVPDVRFLHGRFEDLSLDETFDAIFLTHTLEHLDAPEAVLARVLRWLAPGGRFFVAVPNAHAASRQLAVLMGLIPTNTAVTAGEAAHGHRRTYTADTLHDALRCAGFTVVRSGGIFFKPLANFQFDAAVRAGIVDESYLDACHALAERYPELSASLYAVCEGAS